MAQELCARSGSNPWSMAGLLFHANSRCTIIIAKGDFTFSVLQLLAGGPSNGLAFAESRFLAVIAVFGHLSQRNGVWARSRNKEHVSCNSYGTSNHWQSLRTSCEKPDNRLERVKIISKQSNCLGTRRKKHKTALRRFVFSRYHSVLDWLRGLDLILPTQMNYPGCCGNCNPVYAIF